MSNAARPEVPASLVPVNQPGDDDDPGSPSPAAPGARRPIESKFEVLPVAAAIAALGQPVNQPPQDARFSRAGRQGKPLRMFVVGAAAAGGEVLRQFVLRGMANPSVHIEVIVADDCADTELGVGPAWRELPNRLHEKMQVNMWLPTIAVRRGHGGEIARHVHATSPTPPEAFPSRAAVGRFLRDRFAETLAMAAGSNVNIERLRVRASDVSLQGGDKAVVDAGGVKYPSEAVILALGNVPSGSYKHFAGLRGYVGNPWAFERWLPAVGRSDSVLIAGTSVTAVDSAIALIESGHQGPIMMFSHGGGLPGARSLHVPTELRIVREDTVAMIADSAFGGGFANSKDLERLIAMEFSAQGIPLERLKEIIAHSKLSNHDWLTYTLSRCQDRSLVFGLQKALDDVIPAIWNACRHEAQGALAKKLGDFARVQWPMAPQNARRMLAYMASGQLDVRSGMGQPLYDGTRFIVPFADGSTASGAVFINATGIGGPLDDFECPLVRAMRRRGLLAPHPLWGALADFQTGQLLNSFGKPIGPIWATASALTRGMRLLTNELSEATRSAVRSADAAFDHLMATNGLRVGLPA